MIFASVALAQISGFKTFSDGTYSGIVNINLSKNNSLKYLDIDIYAYLNNLTIDFNGEPVLYSNGLISYYSFDNTTQLGKDSIGLWNLTLFDMNNFTGKFNNSVYGWEILDYGKINDSPLTNNMTNFTINMWIWTNQTFIANQRGYFLTKGDIGLLGSHFFSFEHSETQPFISVSFFPVTPDCPELRSIVQDNNTMWNMHTITRDNEYNLSYYFNGVLINSTICYRPINYTSEWYLNRQEIEQDHNFIAYDEISIWNRSLSEEQVKLMSITNKMNNALRNFTLSIDGYGEILNNVGDNISEKKKYNLNYSKVREVINDGCNCLNCSIRNRDCRVPIRFNAESNGYVEYSNITVDYSKAFFIIDEVNNTLFDVNNVSQIRLHSDTNRTVYDLQALGQNKINVSLEDNNYRLEIKYADDTVITRWIDTDLTDLETRICANREGVEHYEQLLIASSVRKAIARSIFSDCYVAADYTRFAYQDALALRMFTIDTYYTLTAAVDGQDVTLASIDGGLVTFYNLDQLEFREQDLGLNILSRAISVERVSSSDTLLLISYYNQRGTNTLLSATIENMDNDEVVYTQSSFNDPNDASFQFDYSTLSGVTNDTLFKIEFTATDSDGETETSTAYFNVGAQVGLIASGLALTVAILLNVFGFTFVISRAIFSWFGIGLILVAIGILSFAVVTWYTTLMIAIEVILLIYFVSVMIFQGYPNIT